MKRTAFLILPVFIGLSAAAQQGVETRTQKKKTTNQVTSGASMRSRQMQLAQSNAAPPTSSSSATSTVNDGTSVTSLQPVKDSETSFVKLAPVIGATDSFMDGLKVGDSSGDHDSSQVGRIGYQAGVSVLLGRGQLQGETGLVYAERGAKTKDDFIYTGSLVPSVTVTLEREYKINYIELPLLARYSFQPATRSQFFLKGGLVVGFLQSASGSYTASSGGISSGGSDNLKDDLNSVDPRVALGLGGNIRIGRSTYWLIEGDYERSLGKVNKDGDQSLYNSSLAINTGILLSI